MAEALELKKTLNLPKTDFPMKAGLPQNEPKQLEAWHGGNLYERILETRKGKPLFVLHDGPPYPTGEIHLGTGLNKILKDLRPLKDRTLYCLFYATRHPKGIEVFRDCQIAALNTQAKTR